jgi:hypothetical protein
MNQGQSALRWIVNVICFVLVSLLVLTGAINWILPGGHQAAGAALPVVRHLLKQVHQLAAVFFLAALLVHLWQHWAYIGAQLKRMRKNP